ncbi:MAG TPA: CoA transferase [Pseudomonadales bacterium]|nr:CoA transferase [Pseudomonadales bacterium]
MSQPFKNIRVAEFGQFVAVPFCGQLLAQGGAEVIKIESPEGDPNRHMGPLAPGESRIFVSRNRGKHTLPLKLSDPAAQPVIEALLDWADVVLMNFRPGLAEKMGLAPETLLKKHPRLVIGEITPFGKQGPDANLSAMDIVVQARSGLMAAMGRIVDGKPAPGEPVISDYMAATTLAFGIASALFRRERTGKGGVVDVSLMMAAMTLTNNQLVRSEDQDRDKHLQRIAQINELRAAGAPYEEQLEAIPTARVLPIRILYFRTYDSADGTVAIACASRALQKKFMDAIGLHDKGFDTTNDLGDDYYLELRDQVEAVMRSKHGAEWVAILNKAGVPVSTVKFPIEMFEDEQAAANAMFNIVDHPTAGKFRVLSPPLALDGDGFTPPPATAPFGSEAISLLTELGLSAESIEKLVQAGITRISLDT